MSPKKQKGKSKKDPHAPTSGGFLTNKATRETVESVVVAFILAFLFRAFEAEAFVIPTGSMAPTLQGRHKDVYCPECGFNYRASASKENPNPGKPNARSPMVTSCTCPSCGFIMDAFTRANHNRHGRKERSYNGDRILVSKFAYELKDPERWDIIVFRYPGNAKINYIKRLVGLPNETVRLHRGDLLVSPHQESGEPAPFVIARKPADKQRAMMQLVHDNRHLPNKLIEAGWPKRWQRMTFESDAEESNAWREEIEVSDKTPTHASQTWRIDGSNAEQVDWIRYQHFVPDDDHWGAVLRGDRLEPPGSPGWIHDYYAYNDFFFSFDGYEPLQDHEGEYHWVGDLGVECDVDVRGGEGTLMLELLEGGRQFRCEFDISTGKAVLSIDDGAVAFDSADDQPNSRPTVDTKVKGSGRYRLLFTNVDDQLRLWVNGSIIEFDDLTTYPRLANNIRTNSDLVPVGIGARGADLELTGLRVHRDIYYIPVRPEFRGPNVQVRMEDDGTPKDFDLKADQFFALGDNSPQSKDGRLWESEDFDYFVPRDYLIGKALFIYWPHSRDDIFPFCPNFPRMGFVK